jgi:hypothetical protein
MASMKETLLLSPSTQSLPLGKPCSSPLIYKNPIFTSEWFLEFEVLLSDYIYQFPLTGLIIEHYLGCTMFMFLRNLEPDLCYVIDTCQGKKAFNHLTNNINNLNQVINTISSFLFNIFIRPHWGLDKKHLNLCFDNLKHVSVNRVNSMTVPMEIVIAPIVKTININFEHQEFNDVIVTDISIRETNTPKNSYGCNTPEEVKNPMTDLEPYLENVMFSQTLKTAEDQTIRKCSFGEVSMADVFYRLKNIKELKSIDPDIWSILSIYDLNYLFKGHDLKRVEMDNNVRRPCVKRYKNIDAIVMLKGAKPSNNTMSPEDVKNIKTDMRIKRHKEYMELIKNEKKYKSITNVIYKASIEKICPEVFMDIYARYKESLRYLHTGEFSVLASLLDEMSQIKNVAELFMAYEEYERTLLKSKKRIEQDKLGPNFVHDIVVNMLDVKRIYRRRCLEFDKNKRKEDKIIQRIKDALDLQNRILNRKRSKVPVTHKKIPFDAFGQLNKHQRRLYELHGNKKSSEKLSRSEIFKVIYKRGVLNTSKEYYDVFNDEHIHVNKQKKYNHKRTLRRLANRKVDVEEFEKCISYRTLGRTIVEDYEKSHSSSYDMFKDYDDPSLASYSDSQDSKLSKKIALKKKQKREKMKLLRSDVREHVKLLEHKFKQII